jgi:hypothetical protein
MMITESDEAKIARAIDAGQYRHKNTEAVGKVFAFFVVCGLFAGLGGHPGGYVLAGLSFVGAVAFLVYRTGGNL